MKNIKLLSGAAAQGLVTPLEHRFETDRCCCTQVTEIRYTDGVELVAPLPKEFELASAYTAAACTRAAEPEAANQWIALLVSSDAATVRSACGFE